MNVLQEHPSASIERWLESVSGAPKAQPEACAAFQPFDLAMATPQPSLTPTRQHSRQTDRTSPKRPRTDDDGVLDHQDNERSILGDDADNFDHDKTPSASRTSAHPDRGGPGPALDIPIRPLFRQTPSLSTSSAPSQASSTRSSSPVKRSTLRLLRKPVCFVQFGDDPAQQLPADILPAYDRIVDIVKRKAFLPAHVEPEIRSTHRAGIVENRWFRLDDVDRHQADNPSMCPAFSRHLDELSSLRNILKAASSCETEEASEATWNLEVHGPLLKLSLVPFPSLRRDLLTAARISKPFIPAMHNASAYGCTLAKMVDWGVRVCLPPVERAAIGSILDTLLEDERCINQTTYEPVRYDPIAIFIETKTEGGTTKEARLQLGIWVAAWRRRMAALMEKSLPRSVPIDRIITVPLIIIMEHEWRLSLACDRGDRIDIVGEIAMGDTRTLLGLYTIIAVMRRLAAWAEKDFRLATTSLSVGFDSVTRYIL